MHIGYDVHSLCAHDLCMPIMHNRPFPCEKITEKLLHHGCHLGDHYCIGAYE